MKPYRPTFAALRGSICTLAAAVAVTAACQIEVPTAAAIEQLDAQQAETIARQIALVAQSDSAPLIYVDGLLVSRAIGNAIQAKDISSVEVRRAVGAAKHAEIHITTVAGAAAIADGSAPDYKRELSNLVLDRVEPKPPVPASRKAPVEKVAPTRTTKPEPPAPVSPTAVKAIRRSPDTAAAGVAVQTREPSSFTNTNSPVIIVDGVVRSGKRTLTTADMEALNIESIEVVRGEAARKLYGEGAANGVIRITTRKK